MKDVVKRQGSKSFIVNILSVCLGVFNNLIIYPLYLSFYGTFQMVWSFINLMVPFSMLGLAAVVNKFFIEYKDRGKDLLFFALKWLLISISIFSLFYFFVLPSLVVFLKPIFPFIEIVIENKVPLFITLLLYCLIILFAAISNINKRIVVPVLLNKIVNVKMLIPASIVLASIWGYDETKLIWLFTYCFAIIAFIFLIYILKNKWTFNVSEENHEKTPLKEKLTFGAFGSFNQIGMLLAFSIDVILVFFLLGDTSAGFYAIFLFLANVVRLPIDSISGLFLPIVNTFFKNKEFGKISDYYKRMSKIFMFLTIGIFLTIYPAINDILTIMGKDNLINAKYIFSFIAIGIIINGSTSINSEIIIQSEYYKWNLFFICILGIVNIFLSYYLIVYVFPNSYASAGAAMGTAISLAIFNLLKMGFVYFKFKMIPFSKSSLIILGIAGFCFSVLYFVSFTFNPIINLFLYALLVAIIYFLPIFLLKLVKDVNDIFTKNLNKLKLYF